MRRPVLAGVLVVAVACGKKHAADDPAPSPAHAADDGGAAPPVATATVDAGAPAIDAAPVAPAAPPAPVWPELADFTIAAPWRVVDLPVADPSAPEIAAGGPLLMNDVAVVATSRAGFVAIDLTTANVLWSRRAGPRVAPPVSRGDRAILVGDCPPGPTPKIGKDEVSLGCFDIVDPVHITDEHAGVVHGPARALADFARDDGVARTTLTGDGALLWRRGDHAIRVDLGTGAAVAAKPADVADHVDVAYHGVHWTYTLDHGALTGAIDGKQQWTTPAVDAVLVGAFNHEPPQIPLVRLTGRARGRTDAHPPAPATPAHRHGPGTAHDPQRPTRLLLLDVAGTDGTLGQVSHSFAGAAPESSAFGEGGTTIVAVRLDDSAMRHYVAAFDGNGLAMWAWPLPEPPGAAPRTTAPQVAITTDGWVVALFDDRLAIIPLVSQAPTPDLPPSRIPTP